MKRLFSTFVSNKSELAHVSVHPKIPKKGAYRIEMVEGQTYYWCTCGKSESQPWCDGSHKETEFLPLKFTWDQLPKKVSICGCKMNKDESLAICDGSHKYIGNPEDIQQKKVGFFRETEFLDYMESKRLK